ncbi:hypothetical protein [Mesorhizobium carmichaelinearum]|uniref:hypothetical protein n=1 Tax=Mesorhizobium carmichaelinearum TaxID=1208188 RepID=UPI000BA49699|nr:hypothetical protein [Mesorhizobium carmichaelinearum]
MQKPEVMPQDLKIEQLTAFETESIARYLGGVLGIAHGRQMQASTWNAGAMPCFCVASERH